MDHQSNLNIAIESARAAGRFLLGVKVEDRHIMSEDARDVKLKADQEAEKIIFEILQSKSSYPLLGEESGESGDLGEASYFWVVDPLDGTYNYLRDIPICCVSIALVDNSRRPILGVIYDFNHDICYAGLLGHGAWINNQPSKLSEPRSKAFAVLATGFPAATDMSDQSLRAFVSEVQAFKKTRLIGSAALSLAWVASGLVDAYYENDIMLWDVAAGLAILEASGGVYSIATTSKNKWACIVRAASHADLL